MKFIVFAVLLVSALAAPKHVDLNTLYIKTHLKIDKYAITLENIIKDLLSPVALAIVLEHKDRLLETILAYVKELPKELIMLFMGDYSTLLQSFKPIRQTSPDVYLQEFVTNVTDDLPVSLEAMFFLKKTTDLNAQKARHQFIQAARTYINIPYTTSELLIPLSNFEVQETLDNLTRRAINESFKSVKKLKVCLEKIRCESDRSDD